MLDCEYSEPELYFDNTNVYETLGAYRTAVGTYIRNENNYLEGYKKEKEEGRILSDTDVLVKGERSVHKIDGKTGEIIWKLKIESVISMAVDITDTKIIVTDRTDTDEQRCEAKIMIYDRVTGDLISVLESDSPDLRRTFFSKWIEISDNKAYYLEGGFLDESTITVFNIVDNKLINGQVIYSSEKDPLYSEYMFRKVEELKLIDNNLFILKSHWDSLEYTFVTDLIALDENGKHKWRYSYENCYEYGNYVRLEKFDKDKGENYCDILAIAKGNRIVLLELENGEHIFTYELDSLVKNSYCSKDGFFVVLTENGYEVAVLIRKKERGNYEKAAFPMIQLNEFMNEHNLYACFDSSYAVSNSDSNEVYLYSDVQNPDFQNIFKDIEGVNSISINDSETYLAIDSYKEIYIYNLKTKEIYELIKAGEYFKETMFMSDYFYAVIDSENVVNVFDIRTKEMVYKKKCESLATFKGKDSVEALAVDGNLLIQESYGEYSMINKDFETVSWTPERKGDFEKNERESGIIRKIYDLNNSGELLIKVQYGNDEEEYLEIYDLNTGNSVILENMTVGEETGLDIVSVCQGKDDTVSVVLSDNTLRCYDTKTGVCKYSYSCSFGRVVSVISLDSNKAIGVLCNDSILYKIDVDTGTVVDSVDIDNDYVKTATMDKTVARIIPEHNSLIVSGWNGKFFLNHAYIIDLDTFDISFDIDGYIAYCEKEDRLFVEEYNVVGSYPLYDIDELIGKARDYISQ